ncbi:MAG: sigma-70 family RNA polymerase sigma factor [Acidobacteriota bacterium]
MPRRFDTTRWSLVLAARGPTEDRSREALQSLCQIYWSPLNAHVRRRVGSSNEADDLTQAFFTGLLERETLAEVAPEGGRLRSFLLACLDNFLANEWDRARAQKRGAGRVVSLDAETTAERRGMEPRHEETPDRIFERDWALTVIGRAREALRKEMLADGHASRHALFEPHLTGETAGRPYREIAEELGISESAVKVAVHRLRKRFGALLRREVRETVATEEAVGEELRHLLAVLSSAQA